MPSEVVLRGGYLKQPILLTRLVVSGGKKFVYLWKGSPELNKFLTGLSSCKRPLASCLVFEKLAERRNAAYRQALVDLKASATEASRPNEGRDLADRLELDADAPQEGDAPEEGAAPKERLRVFKKFRPQLPRFVAVDIEKPGQETWSPLLLLEPATKAPAMEATADNFASLFALVDNERLHGSCARKQRGASSRAPRGPQHAREYFVRPASRPSHWVRKEPAAPSATGSARPYAKRYKTLVRRRSDEGASEAASAASPADSSMAVGDQDCLS